ncbi:SRPBCC family protein [Massilia niastensis]|uniref:SRPBCC family protein n=1 Tax=Massilia niastensis TaxID=544911 RepID=UPI00035D95EE|nr:SRPBCC family protein [Massilia niastensis]
MTASTNTDSIERSIAIKAPRARVWRALVNAEEFGSWFGVNLKGQSFAPDGLVRGHITHPGYEHLQFEVRVDRVEPEHLLSFYWHPYAIDPEVDYTQEEPTLVTFTLQDTPDKGTLLKVVESGFDRVPPHRRLEAFRMNSQGWDAQVGNIARHVGG